MHRCGFEIDAAAMTEKWDTQKTMSTRCNWFFKTMWVCDFNSWSPAPQSGWTGFHSGPHPSLLAVRPRKTNNADVTLQKCQPLILVRSCSAYATATRVGLTRSKTWFPSIFDSVLDVHKKDDDSSHISCDPTPD